MKRIINIITICFVSLMILGGCKKDNYAAPDGIINGRIIDATTGQPLLSGDMSLNVTQTSYTKGTPIPYTYGVKIDGTYKNEKVFAGTYKIYPQNGPFVPLFYTDGTGAIVDNGSKSVTVKSKGTTTTDWTVTPFLKVEWVGEPVLNADGTVTVQIKFTRGTTDPLWQKDVKDAYLFISNNQFISAGSNDPNTSFDQVYSGTAGTALLGTTVSLTSKIKLAVHQNFTLRVGVRTNDTYKQAYNYTTVKTITIP